MVIFAIGGVIIGGVVGAASYDDHSDYSDYSNYSNYSDAAERRRREIEAKRNNLQAEKNSLVKTMDELIDSDIKNFTSNMIFYNKRANDMTSDDVYKMNNSVCKKIEIEKKFEISEKTKNILMEISNIDEAINELESLRKNMNQ